MIRTMKSSETAAINETQTPLNDENEEDEGERGDLWAPDGKPHTSSSARRRL